ncbi:hypothetical protein [Streptosporangium sp. NPDC006930]|uniref:hypothetical protein n=1 Tax=unclassified Streptosporangium TaxID=2632669 RepID=UPI003439F639
MTHDRQVSCAPSGQITRSRRRLEHGRPFAAVWRLLDLLASGGTSFSQPGPSSSAAK